jgi:hypothetical protein
MEGNPLEINPPSSLSKRKINKRFIYLVLAIFVLLIVFISYKALNSKKSQNLQSIQSQPIPSVPTDTPTPVETSTPTPTITPTPKPAGNPVDSQTGLDRSRLSVTVENGSGEEGVAGKASDILKNLGYNVVSTQNADNFDYTNVTIQVKFSFGDYLELLKKDLGFYYAIQKATSDLPDSFSSDALVIIGK